MSRNKELPKGNKITEKIVWSNGNVVRQYRNQNEDSVWHNPKDGYRKMVMQLYEYKDLDKERDIINKFCKSIKEKYPDIKFKIEYDEREDFWDIWHNHKDWDEENFRKFVGGKIIKYFSNLLNTGYSYSYHIFEDKGDVNNEK